MGIWKRLGEKGLGLVEDSWKVICSGKLSSLVDDGYLERQDLGHKNVRYRFRSEEMRGKARLLVFTESDKLKNILFELIDKEKELGSDRIDALEFFLMVPSALHNLYTVLLLRALKEEQKEGLDFYRESELRVLKIFRDWMIEMVTKRDAAELEKSLTEIIGFRVDDTHLSVEGLIEFFETKLRIMV